MTFKRIQILVLVLLLLGGLITFFYPRERIIGGLRGGPIGPGATAYREEYDCLGFTYDFTPPWPDYGGKFFCYGIRYDRQCFMDTEGDGRITKVKTGCR